MEKEKTPVEILFDKAQKAKGNKYAYAFVSAKVFDKAVQTLPIQNYVSAKGSAYASFFYFDVQFKRQPPSNISSTKHA